MPPPCCAQLPYNVVSRSWVEGRDEAAALAESGASVVASAVLAGGALTGKYDDPGASGRMAEKLADPSVRDALEAGRRVRELAERHGISPAALAIAFALEGDRVASVLFGATSTEQVRDNARALQVSADAVAELRRL